VATSTLTGPAGVTAASAVAKNSDTRPAVVPAVTVVVTLVAFTGIVSEELVKVTVAVLPDTVPEVTFTIMGRFTAVPAEMVRVAVPVVAIRPAVEMEDVRV